MTPHTEPESLDAWARRTAPTLTDEQWAAVFDEPDPDNAVWWPEGTPRDGFCGDVSALLAELDRIAGKLTPKAREYLRLSLGEVPGEEWPHGPQAAALARKGLVQYAEHIDGPGGPRDWRRGYMCTPLGRAVLARKAAQR